MGEEGGDGGVPAAGEGVGETCLLETDSQDTDQAHAQAQASPVEGYRSAVHMALWPLCAVYAWIRERRCIHQTPVSVGEETQLAGPGYQHKKIASYLAITWRWYALVCIGIGRRVSISMWQ